MFKIYCLEDCDGLKYVGITKRKLSIRLKEHRNDRKSRNCSSNKLNLDNCKIKLLEECDDKDREIYWIKKIDCVNHNTYQRDKKEYHKNYDLYKKSWGGHRRWNNNLLEIDIDIFTS